MKKKQRTQIKADVIPMIEKVAQNPTEVKLLKDAFNRVLVKGNEKQIYGFMQDLTRTYVTQKMQESALNERAEKVKAIREAETN